MAATAFADVPLTSKRAARKIIDQCTYGGER
jgi:hypothetical protein